MNNKNRLAAISIVSLLTVAVLSITDALAAGRYTVSADDLEVSDSQTGLIWRRPRR